MKEEEEEIGGGGGGKREVRPYYAAHLVAYDAAERVGRTEVTIEAETSGKHDGISITIVE